MKKLILLLAMYPALTYAQSTDQPLSKDELTGRNQADQVRTFGYKTAVPGWIIKEGDTLALGKGSLPNKDFAFLYENPGAFTATYSPTYGIVRKYLQSFYTGKKVVLKSLGIAGGKKIGFSTYGLVGVGNIVRYYAEIDNAIEAGEILPPAKYKQTTAGATINSSSVADELLKLKSLLDAGAITQQEYDNQKKKILNN